MIRKLMMPDVESAYSLLSEAGKALYDSGIDQWDEMYPARNDVENDILNGECFGLFSDNQLTSCMTLNRFNDPEYKAVSFACADASALTIHRLAVAPSCQGRGLAAGMIDFAEHYAGALGFSSLRLDVFSSNPAAIRLYERMGYQRRGMINFRKGKFYLYEKAITLSGRELYEAVSDYRNSALEPVNLTSGKNVVCLEDSDPEGDWPGWVLCSIDGNEAWVPVQIIKRKGKEGIVTEDYCNIEFDLARGEYIIPKRMLNGWIWGYKPGCSGDYAWAPLNYLKKIHPN